MLNGMKKFFKEVLDANREYYSDLYSRMYDDYK